MPPRSAVEIAAELKRATGSDRRPELDVLRVLVVAGLIVFHSAIVFDSLTDWFVKNQPTSDGFAVFVLWASLWGMPLLFLVSGMGVWYALHKRTAAGFVGERIRRLLVPFLIGVPLLVPPMFYLQLLAQPDYSESYGRSCFDSSTLA